MSRKNVLITLNFNPDIVCMCALCKPYVKRWTALNRFLNSNRTWSYSIMKYDASYYHGTDLKGDKAHLRNSPNVSTKSGK